MAFDKPDAPSVHDPDAPQWSPDRHVGDLLVVQVQDAQRGVVTEYGERDVIVADVHVIDPAGRVSVTYENTWLFGTVLFSQLREKKGRTVLGVFVQGEKRPGRKPPWKLDDATDAQEALALRAMASKPDAPVDPEPQPAAAGAGKAPWE